MQEFPEQLLQSRNSCLLRQHRLQNRLHTYNVCALICSLCFLVLRRFSASDRVLSLSTFQNPQNALFSGIFLSAIYPMLALSSNLQNVLQNIGRMPPSAGQKSVSYNGVNIMAIIADHRPFARWMIYTGSEDEACRSRNRAIARQRSRESARWRRAGETERKIQTGSPGAKRSRG